MDEQQPECQEGLPSVCWVEGPPAHNQVMVFGEESILVPSTLPRSDWAPGVTAQLSFLQDRGPGRGCPNFWHFHAAGFEAVGSAQLSLGDLIDPALRLSLFGSSLVKLRITWGDGTNFDQFFIDLGKNVNVDFGPGVQARVELQVPIGVGLIDGSPPAPPTAVNQYQALIDGTLVATHVAQGTRTSMLTDRLFSTAANISIIPVPPHAKRVQLWWESGIRLQPVFFQYFTRGGVASAIIGQIDPIPGTRTSRLIDVPTNAMQIVAVAPLLPDLQNLINVVWEIQW